MRGHGLWMLLACLLPLLLIFVLPVLGLRGGWVIFGAIALMFVFHLVMFAWADGDVEHKDMTAGGSGMQDRGGTHESHQR